MKLIDKDNIKLEKHRYYIVVDKASRCFLIFWINHDYDIRISDNEIKNDYKVMNKTSWDLTGIELWLMGMNNVVNIYQFDNTDEVKDILTRDEMVRELNK